MPFTATPLRNITLNPNLVSFRCNDTYQQIITPGYLDTLEMVQSMTLFNNGQFIFLENDFVFIEFLGGTGVFNFLPGSNCFSVISSSSSGIELSYDPIVTFVLPGDLNVNYGLREGRYLKQGPLTYVHINLAFSLTYTTASQQLLVSLPSIVRRSYSASIESIQTQFIQFPAGTTFITPDITSNFGQVLLTAQGSTTTAINLDTTSFPSGNAYSIQMNFIYL